MWPIVEERHANARQNNSIARITKAVYNNDKTMFAYVDAIIRTKISNIKQEIVGSIRVACQSAAS